MNTKSLKRDGAGSPENPSRPNQPSAGLSTVGQQLLIGLLTRKQVAAQIQTCTHTIARYTRRGLLPAIVFNKRMIRYKPEAVEEFIRSACIE